MSSRPGRSVLERLGGAYRAGLVLVAVVLVMGAFGRVGWRELGRLLSDDREGVVELVLMHWSGGGGQQEDDIVEASIRAFEERNPGVRVKRINPGDSGQYFTKLQTMMLEQRTDAGRTKNHDDEHFHNRNSEEQAPLAFQGSLSRRGAGIFASSQEVRAPNEG